MTPPFHLRRAPPASLCTLILIFACCRPCGGAVEGQPLGANALRLIEALEFLGAPLPPPTAEALRAAAVRRDAVAMQDLLDPLVLLQIEVQPERSLRLARGAATAELDQHGFRAHLIKVINRAGSTAALRLGSPQAGAVYAGAARGSLERQQQTELKRDENLRNEPGRFFSVELFTSPPMTPRLSGLEIEYALALLSSTEAGAHEATITCELDADNVPRGEARVRLNVRPAVPIKLALQDETGAATVARLEIRDRLGRVYPAQAKRLAPDFFFQPQIYRHDGDTLLLPPGKYDVRASRGPEYRVQRRTLDVPSDGAVEFDVRLERWVDAAAHGFYSGDHHIHASGCAHYEKPTEGVRPEDMFLQVKGEGLNVGCVLTWGPGFAYQRQFFSPRAHAASEPLTVLKYDLEISGFGSAALGHVVLLNLENQTYPGSDGTTERWPTWTVPVMRWARQQGGIAGFPHSDMGVNPAAYAARFIARCDLDRDGRLTSHEARRGLLLARFERLDADRDGLLTTRELTAAADAAADELPNLVLPSMQGGGAMEVFVATAEGVCDFISAMDTGRVGEWNTWYHLLNAGFPLKVSGETDFPCMSGTRVGHGRVYVKMADRPIARVDFSSWARRLAEGRSYVSDGYAHALAFAVNGVAPGPGPVELPRAGRVSVRAEVAFVPEVPKAVAHGTLPTPEPRRQIGTTRALLAAPTSETVVGGERLVELVVNGRAVASRSVPADGATHPLSFEIPVSDSSWIALRHFPQLHTNPVEVRVSGRPIRASADSARWCAEAVELLWENRSAKIAAPERAEARAAYDRAIAEFRRRASEAELR